MAPPRRQRLQGASRRVREASHPTNLVERRMSKFLREPPSVRTAAGVIVWATAVVVVIGGILFRVFDHHEYPNIWVGMWLSVQTVTTVGYGDVTPTNVIGRIIAGLVMLEGVAFVAIITAAVTSTFVARAERERYEAEAGSGETREQQLEERIEKLEARLDERFDQLEAMVQTPQTPRSD
jgi:voltage-gated potassium channel